MTARARLTGTALAVLVIAGATSVLAQTAPSRDFAREIEKELAAAKEAAQFDFLGTLNRNCLLPASGGEDNSDIVPNYIADPSKAPRRAAWYAEPARVFDNLYFVGGKIHSAWALRTSEGIILLETIYPYNSEELIVEGMKKLGLDPADIKYVVVSHAHGDHIGGAEMIQKRYSPRLVMGGPDWDLVEKFPNRYKTMAPKRDIVAKDGMNVTLGDTTVSVYETPGHTPGTLSYTFTVKDNGRPLTVAYSGGTAFNFVNNTPDPGIRNFQIYIDSHRHIAERAKAAGASVLLSNHSEFDDAVDKIRMIAGRGNGPHPFDIGEEAVQRYFEVTQHCARAAQIRLEKRASRKS